MKNKFLSFTLVLIALLGCGRSYAADWLYTMRPGDNIGDLCLEYTNEPSCWAKLDKANQGKYPKGLPPGFVISFPVEWLKAIPTPVAVTFVRGDVKVYSLDDEKAQSVSVGDKLSLGAKIVTAQGDVNLRFSDGSTLQMEPNSEVILDTLSAFDGEGMVDSRLRLNQGAVKTRVVKRKPASRFQITTPTAVAAVRGTEYRISAIPGEKTIMRGEVFEGLVDIDANNTLQPVDAGFGLVAKTGEAVPPPRPLLPPPTFTVDDAPKSLPALISWQQLKGALSYQLEILKDNDKEELLQRFMIKGQQKTVESLSTGCYRLRLRGIDFEELQGLAGLQKLCIAPEVAAPKLKKKNINYDSKFVSSISWLASNDSDQYRVQIAKDANFNTIVEDTIISEPRINLSGEEIRYIRVQIVSATGQTSKFSDAIKWQPQANLWPPIIFFGLMILAIL